jgi:hypothetical protein
VATAGLYRRSPAVDETTVGERIVLYHRVTGSAIVLNPTASVLWRKLDRERDHADLVKSLHDGYPQVSESVIDADVTSCLADLVSHQLIRVESSSELAAS